MRCINSQALDVTGNNCQLPNMEASASRMTCPFPRGSSAFPIPSERSKIQFDALGLLVLSLLHDLKQASARVIEGNLQRVILRGLCCLTTRATCLGMYVSRSRIFGRVPLGIASMMYEAVSRSPSLSVAEMEYIQLQSLPFSNSFPFHEG